MKFTPKNIELMSAYWQVCAPFFSEFLLRFTYIKSEKIPTMGVSFQNKALTLYYNPKFMESLSTEELAGVLAHEIMHIIYNHSFRFDALTASEKSAGNDHTSHDIYNYAADTVINEMILNDLTVNGKRLSLPENCWTLKHPLLADFEGPLTTESVYFYLYDKIPKVTLKINNHSEDKSDQSSEGQSSSGENTSGSGSANSEETSDANSTSGSLSGEGEEYEVTVFDVHNQLQDLNSHEAKEMVELIKYTAQIKGWGTMAGNGVDTIKGLIRPKKVPIQKVLRSVLQATADGHLVKFDTYHKMNRRGLPLLPGKKKKGSVINMVVDTSGSCFSDETVSLFFSEIDYLSNRVKDINLIQFDTEVTSMKKYTKGCWKKFELNGGGGTDVQPVFDYLRKNKLSKYPTIIFTDGYFNWNIQHYGVMPLWVLDNKDVVNNVSFGSSFVLSEE